MKIICVALSIGILLCYSLTVWGGSPIQGFSLMDSLEEVTFHYTNRNGLIILSPTINDSIRVNLILDSGSRNTIVFGRRFLNDFNLSKAKHITFSGLGDGKPVQGRVTIGNHFLLSGIEGNNICVIVVPKRGMFFGISDIDGVIGYDILHRFEIEVDPSRNLISFRPAGSGSENTKKDYFQIDNANQVPIIRGEITYENRVTTLPVLVDTGSVLGILYKAQDFSMSDTMVIGVGINGSIKGKDLLCKKLKMGSSIVAADIPIYMTAAANESGVSVGMDFLKNYSFILNITKGYLVLKKIEWNSKKERSV